MKGFAAIDGTMRHCHVMRVTNLASSIISTGKTLMADITAWHGRTLAERDAAAKQGYRFPSLSIYGPIPHSGR